METKEVRNDEILTEKTEFSDTGSAIFIKDKETAPESNDFGGISLKNAQNQPKTEENDQSQPIFHENQADLFNKSSKEAFSHDYPNVDLEKLINRQDFQSFLAILTQNPTLSQIYECYNKIFEAAEENSQKKLISALANAKSSVGPLSSAQNTEIGFFTKEQVKQMSPAQIRAHYKEIRQSQSKW